MLDIKEKLSEVFTNVKERFTSPLFYSFIVSWVAINWKVAFGLIWYNSTEIHALGNSDVFDFILKNIESAFLMPMGFACLYVFIIAPIARNVNDVANTLFNILGSKASRYFSKTAAVNFLHYQKLETEYNVLLKSVSETINQNDERNSYLKAAQDSAQKAQAEVTNLQVEVGQLKGTLAEAKSNLDNVKREKDYLQLNYSSTANIAPLVGEWFLTLDGGAEPDKVLNIWEDRVEIIDKKVLKNYKIVHFFSNPQDSVMVIVISDEHFVYEYLYLWVDYRIGGRPDKCKGRFNSQNAILTRQTEYTKIMNK